MRRRAGRCSRRSSTRIWESGAAAPACSAWSNGCTSSTDLRFWRALDRASVPTPRYGGAKHVEVSKERQVLFLVNGGLVTLIVPVSTGATGNTPVGVWHVYSRVPGYNAEQMYYSSFFVGAFAIHGYHSVPPYPASHGCVRIPIWVAPRVYSLIDYGTT